MKILIKPDIWIKLWGRVIVIPRYLAKEMWKHKFIEPVNPNMAGGEVKLTLKGKSAIKEGYKL